VREASRLPLFAGFAVSAFRKPRCPGRRVAEEARGFSGPRSTQPSRSPPGDPLAAVRNRGSLIYSGHAQSGSFRDHLERPVLLTTARLCCPRYQCRGDRPDRGSLLAEAFRIAGQLRVADLKQSSCRPRLCLRFCPP